MKRTQTDYICPKAIVLFSMSVFIIYGCNHERQKKPRIPESISQLKHLTVYSPTVSPVDTVELVQKTVFESNKHVFINGYIGAMALDSRNRVYIAASKPGSADIYVFEPGGRFLTTVGRYGKGPGEFESIGSLTIGDSVLYVFDPRLQKISLFSLENYAHIKDEILRRDSLEKSNDLARRLRGKKIYITGGRNLLLSMEIWGLNKKTDISKIFYYRLSPDGMIVPDPVLKQERFHFYFPQKNNELKLPFTMPFIRGSLIAVTKGGGFFTAWTENFLIKKYDKNGNYTRAFYYPIKKATLSINELKIGKHRQKVLNNYRMPKTWPALHAMEVDTKGRLWIATITDSKTSYKWWVLNQNGKLIARFTLSGKRAARSVMTKPIIVIKNGYFYKHQFDFHAGIDRIVRYKIKMSRVRH